MIITLIIIYLVSVIGAYKAIQYSYFNPKGEWYLIREGRGYPNFQDFLFTIIPILNLVEIIRWFNCYIKHKNLINWNKFFNRW